MAEGAGGAMEGQNSRALLLEAVQALYHHPDPETRKSANRWLEDFQYTMDAWQVSDSVLHDPSSTIEALYFCAQTLRTKVQRDFEDLPPNASLSLRSSLMTLLVKFCNGPSAVRTQLCLGMVALAVHMPSNQWGSGGVVQWLGSQLGAQADAIPCFLELVAVLPQEATSYKISVRPEKSRQFQRELESSVNNAFTLLTSCLSGGSLQLREQVLRAFASWLRVSEGIPASTLATHPLVAASLQGLDSEETFDAAVDAITELIRYTVSGNPGELAANMSLVQVIVPRIMALLPRFSAAVKAARAEKQVEQVLGGETGGAEGEDEEDEEITKGMAYLFADMGEAYVDLIANGSAESLMIVEAIAEVTSHPDDNIAAMTFNFWNRLSRVLTGSEGLGLMLSFQDGAAVELEKEKRLAIFRPKFELLVSLVSFRVTYPPGYEEWRKDELADFKQTRYAVADLLMDAAAVIGGDATLHLLAQPLLETAAGLERGGSWEWKSVEASLYCIRAIAKAVSVTENAILPQVAALLPRLPHQPQLLYTSSLTIAALADWLGATASSPTMLPNILGVLIIGLSVPDDTCAAASLALKHVCDACRDELGKSVEPLLGVYREALSGTGKFPLAAEDELQLVEGLSMVVSALPPEKMPPALEALCMPVLLPLGQLVAEAEQSGSPQCLPANQYIIHIDRIANIFGYVTQPELLAGLFQRIWPLLQAVFNQRADDGKTMERLCRACKYAVRNCERALAGMMGVLLQELQERFQQQQHPCLLYLASEVIKVFGKDPACANYLATLITVLFGQTIRLLQNIRDFTSRPDLADDCFLLASRCNRYCPGLLVSSPIMGPLFQCALAGFTIQHREACRSILNFLREFLELPISQSGKQYRGAIDAVVLPNGPIMTRVIIGALVGALPESRMDDITDVLLALSRLYGQLVVQWAQHAVALIPDSVVTEAERNNFLQALSVAAGGRDTAALTRSIEELSGVCRRNRKVMDVVKNALQPRMTLSPTG
ncbi:unnamed protein product [Calypogeia fissa]